MGVIDREGAGCVFSADAPCPSRVPATRRLPRLRPVQGEAQKSRAAGAGSAGEQPVGRIRRTGVSLFQQRARRPRGRRRPAQGQPDAARPDSEPRQQPLGLPGHGLGAHRLHLGRQNGRGAGDAGGPGPGFLPHRRPEDQGRPGLPAQTGRPGLAGQRHLPGLADRQPAKLHRSARTRAEPRGSRPRRPAPGLRPVCTAGRHPRRPGGRRPPWPP